jgi:translocation and assembly module TamA
LRLLLPILAALAAPALAQEVTLALPPGAPEELRTVLENASLTLSLEGEGLTAAQDYVAAARADYRRLLTGLYAEGYYGGAISITVDGREAEAIPPLDAPATVSRVVLSVAPGPRFTFGRVALGPTAPATVLPEGFAPGEVARSETVREAVRVAIAEWRSGGHAVADVASQDLAAIQPEARLDVAVAIDPGPRLAFGPVAVTGNRDVRTARILAIAGIPSGQVFSPEDLERAVARLRRSGAFDAVAAIEEEPTPQGTLPVSLQVTESLPRRIGFAAELSSQDGLSASAFWLHRNLRGGAERLRVEAEASNIEGAALDTAGGGADYALRLSFGRPATLSPDTDLTVEAEVAREDAEDFLLDQATLAVGLTRYATDDLTLSGAVGLLVATEEDVEGTSDFALVTLPLSAEWDRRDDPRDATRGFLIDAEATPFLAVGGDAASGGRLYADARLYRTFGTRVTLAARGQVGTLLGADARDVPASFGFLAGGGGSVRGRSFQSIGVEVTEEDGDEATLAGASLAGVQLEARVGLAGAFSGVAFADAAAVGEGLFPEEGDAFGAGAGLGVRYDTAVGPVRLDVATPASGEDAFGAVQLYIGIGQSF